MRMIKKIDGKNHLYSNGIGDPRGYWKWLATDALEAIAARKLATVVHWGVAGGTVARIVNRARPATMQYGVDPDPFAPGTPCGRLEPSVAAALNPKHVLHVLDAYVGEESKNEEVWERLPEGATCLVHELEKDDQGRWTHAAMLIVKGKEEPEWAWRRAGRR